MHTGKKNYSMALSLMHCFNVVAICSLAIWHAYAFYLDQAIKPGPTSPAIEFQFQGAPVAVPPA
jgi:hypothetical protein